MTRDRFLILEESSFLEIPEFMLPSTIHNKGNYLISLSQTTRWLGEQAEGLGVDILPGFAVDRPFYNPDGSVGGVITSDMGVAKDGSRKDTF